MMDYLRSLMGIGDVATSKRQEYIGLAAEFEKTVTIDFPNRKTVSKTIETAKKIRDLLGSSELGLEREEKLRLLKMMNKAKVRALMAQEDYAFDLFANLDSISSDVAVRV